MQKTTTFKVYADGREYSFKSRAAAIYWAAQRGGVAQRLTYQNGSLVSSYTFA